VLTSSLYIDNYGINPVTAGAIVESHRL